MTFSFTYMALDEGPAGVVRGVVRAAAAEAPAWDITVPLSTNFQQGFAGGFYSTLKLGGLDYVFYSYPDADGIHQDFVYITSAGIGFGWSSTVFIDQFDFSGTASIGSSVQAAAFTDDWAITMLLSPGAGTTDGQGYFEGAAAPTAPAINIVLGLKGMKVYPQQ